MVDYHPYRAPHAAYPVPNAHWTEQQRLQDLEEFTKMYDYLSQYHSGYGSSDSASTAPSNPPAGTFDNGDMGAQYPSLAIQPPYISVTGPEPEIAHQLPSSIDPRQMSLQNDPYLMFNITTYEEELGRLFTLDEPPAPLPTPTQAMPTLTPTASPVPVQAPAQASAPVPAPTPSPVSAPRRQRADGSIRSNRQRQRESSAKMMTTAAAASAGKKDAPACLACKKAKTKCRPSPSGRGRCLSCETHDKDCVPGNAGGRSQQHSTISSLEKRIRELYGRIERQMLALNGGGTNFFGPITMPDLEPRPCDCPLSDSTSAHRAGCRIADPSALYMRAQFMELKDPDEEGEESDLGEDIDMGSGGSESDDHHSSSNASMISPIAASGTPFGLFFDLSRDLGSPGSEHAPGGSPSSTSIGLASPDYFTPGPAARPEIRRIMIEQGKLPSFLIQKTVSPADCLELFDRFMKYWNVSVSVLDPKLHTAKYVLARCPFLFTVVLAIAARDYHKPHYGLLMKEATRLAGEAYVEGWKCVENVQAFILLATFPAPSRRYEEDRAWMYMGGAVRMAMELDLNRPPEPAFANETAEREYLNRIRTWLICHNLEVSGSAKSGKPITVQEDGVILGSKSWWNKSKYNMPYDIHLCAFTQICMIFHKYYRVLVSDSNARAAYAAKDVFGIAEQFTKEINDFQDQFEKLFANSSDPNDPRCSYRAHVRYTAHYFRLVIYSQCHRQSSVQGIQPGDPILLYCIDAATQLVKALTDHHAYSPFFKYSAEGWFTFGAFAGAFMIK
ncbi:hypothetical protein FRC12_012756, partial [Ceratobasidium sp. 428]